MSLVDRIRDLLNFDSDKDTTSFEATDAAIDKAKTRNLSTNNFQGRWRGDVLLHVLLYTWVIFFTVRYDIESLDIISHNKEDDPSI